MYESANRSTRLCSYEDVVVRAWKMFPSEFGLRGYTDMYPNASDLHKPLYGPLKKQGYVRSQNKKFGLTERGLATAQRLAGHGGTDEGSSRLERHQRDEIARLRDKAALRLVATGQQGDMLDTDFYDFYSVTVRTKPGDFAGRVRTVDEALDAAVRSHDPSVDAAQVALALTTRDELRERFGELMRARVAPREKSR